MKPRHYGNRAPGKAAQRVALMSMLWFRRSLDGVDLESLSRSYGLSAAEVCAAVEAERVRRETRA